MDKNIKIACVNYLNSFPLIAGLENSHLDAVQLQLMKPKDCYYAFQNGSVDISLVPTGALQGLDSYQIFGSTCIGSLRDVYSVAVFSDCQLQNIETIYIDDHSTTSVDLLRILLSEYLCIHVNEIITDVADIKLSDNEAVLMIGDKAFAGYKRYKYAFDLGRLWNVHTGLPFVYACWVAQPYVNDDHLVSIDHALIKGTHMIDEILNRSASQFPNLDVRKYFTEYIDYTFDAKKKKGLEMYLSHQSNLEANKVVST